ncbi:hypothetical protein FOA52_003657 [Chlamydomonas sp. UWO 241]|nr:hypothetical protein FOA52_003657 [Chlamydomonas sp. UWO 241]
MGPAWTPAHASSEGEEETVEVCFVDPRTVLDKKRWAGGGGSLEALEQEGHVVTVKVPVELMRTMHQARHEMGDGDDPLNAWVFGQQDEIFRYRLMGQHTTQSGFTSVLPRSIMAAVAAGKVDGLPSWLEFTIILERNPKFRITMKHPFLFAGRVVESHAASVYSLTSDGVVTGVLVSSESS